MARGPVEIALFQHVGETTSELVRVAGDLEVVDLPPADGDRLVAANFHLNASPFQITDDCLLQVRGFVAGNEIKLGGLYIKFQPGEWPGDEPTATEGSTQQPDQAL